MSNPINLKKLQNNQTGMVGIGTLIVFIAMIIVSAVAAGVLINTTGMLQQQARETGERTISEISSGVKVLSAKGRTTTNEKIDNVILVVRPYAGSQGINLENTVVQFKSDYEVDSLTYSSTGPTSGSTFGVTGLQDTSGTGATMLQESGDVAKITIDISTNLGVTEEGSVTIIPNQGFQSYYGVMTPYIMKENTWYEL